ncbi:hypothetical protein N9Q76_01225 [Flavobacteriales bacterium]|nr:hypothetical protein [Flavobacteriales bacterium]
MNSQANKTYFDDINLTVSSAASTAEPYFSAVITEAHDYHEFGQLMEVRGFKGDYRYGYQGSEKDNEISGDGSSYTTQFRQLDPRLGRWMAPDPVFQPWQSPYTSMDNNPIGLNDVMGLKAGDKVEVDGKQYTEGQESKENSSGNSLMNVFHRGGFKNVEGTKSKVYTDDNGDKYIVNYRGGAAVFSKLEPVTPSEEKENTETANEVTIEVPTTPKSEPNATPKPDDKPSGSSEKKGQSENRGQKKNETGFLNSEQKLAVKIDGGVSKALAFAVDKAKEKTPNYDKILKKNPGAKKAVEASKKAIAKDAKNFVKAAKKLGNVLAAVNALDDIYIAYKNPTDENVGQAVFSSTIAAVGPICPPCGLGLTVINIIGGEELNAVVGETAKEVYDALGSLFGD